MSIAQPQTPTAKTAANNRELTIVSHSTLFYWWPVWALGFLLGLLALFSGQRMIVFQYPAEVVSGAEVTGPSSEGVKKTYTDREVLVLPEKARFPRIDPSNPNSEPQ